MIDVKKLRSDILKYLYENRSSYWVDTDALHQSLDVPERELHTEIMYLKDKYLVETVAEFIGKEFLYFKGVKITSSGIDLVENPEDNQGLFSINISSFGNVTNSNLSIGSQHINQSLTIDKTDKELVNKIEELKEALEEKDQSKAIKALNYIGDKSVDLFISILASGLLQR